MRVLAFDRFKPGVTMETVTPHLPLQALYRGDVDVAEPCDRTATVAAA